VETWLVFYNCTCRLSLKQHSFLFLFSLARIPLNFKLFFVRKVILFLILVRVKVIFIHILVIVYENNTAVVPKIDSSMNI